MSLALLLLLLPAPAWAGDEGETLMMARDNVEKIAEIHKVGASDRFGPICKESRSLHNGMKSKKMRGAIQKALGKVARSDGPEAMVHMALDTLALLDDPDGVYKQVRRLLPEPTDREMTDLGERALGVLAKNPGPAAERGLRTLAKTAKAIPARVAAIEALGNYRPVVKSRVNVFRALLDLQKQGRPEPDLPADDPAHAIWAAIEQPLIDALGELTFLDHATTDAWLAWAKEHGRKPGAVFKDAD